jgi:hypothetical protein
VTEVVGPSPKHSIQLAKEIGERLFVPCLVIARTLALMEASAFFDGQVYTNRLRFVPFTVCRWMRQPRKVKPSSMWHIPVFSSDRRRPIGDRTAATSSRGFSAWVGVPATNTTR